VAWDRTKSSRARAWEVRDRPYFLGEIVSQIGKKKSSEERISALFRKMGRWRELVRAVLHHHPEVGWK